jgi:hypothetical protein
LIQRKECHPTQDHNAGTLPFLPLSLLAMLAGDNAAIWPVQVAAFGVGLATAAGILYGKRRSA